MSTFTVAVATGTRYQIGGSGDVFTIDGSQPASYTFPWIEGAVLRFDQSGASNDGNPLVFSTSNSVTLSLFQGGIISSGITYYLDGSSNQSDYTNTTTFNAASTRYIEVTISSSTTFYFGSWANGISVGGVIDVTQDTWSAGSWGEGNWSSQNDIDISPTGFSITASLGDLAYAAATDGWGRQAWGDDDWGTDTLTVIPTGLSMTGSLGTMTAAAEQGWGRSTWGNEPWGDSNSPVVALTGLSMTASLGTLAYSAATDGWSRLSWGENDWGTDSLSFIPTGLSMTGSLGTMAAAAEQGWGRSSWGNQPWGDSYSPVVNLTGLSMTGALGTLAYAQAEDGWGRDEWGTGNWGQNTTTVILDGLEMTGELGREGWGRNTWGSGTWGEQDTVTIEIGEPLTGFAITGSLGTATPLFDFKLVLTDSLLMTASRGAISINNGADHTQGLGGQLITGTLNGSGLDIADVVFGPTTYTITASLGAAAAGDVRRIPVTGFGITASLGSLGTFPDIAVGLADFAITGSLGSLTIVDTTIGVSGFGISGTLGSSGVSPLHYKDVDITGNTSYTYVKHAGE